MVMKRLLNKKTTVVSIVIVIGCSICANSMRINETSNSLLMENVEALAVDESEDSECSGTGQYAKIAVVVGKSQARLHFADGYNGSNGLDMVYEV